MSLTNSQINTILREYDDKQFRHKAELDERIKEIYLKFPEYKRLDEALISYNMDHAKRAILFNEPLKLDLISKRNNQVISEKKHILTSAGYPDNYLEMQYDCPKCQDTGYIDNKPCSCFRQAAIKLLYSQALTNTAINTQNFSTFDYSLYDSTTPDPVLNITPYDNIVKVVGVAKKFIEELNIEPASRNIKNLLIMGKAGAGKTFLSNCIAKEAIELTKSVVYITAGELFDILERNSFNRDYDNDDTDASLENIEQCDLLIIDDLGTEFTNRFTTSKLYTCINNRLLKNLPMVISTNLNYKDLQSTYSDRICSRLLGDFTGLIVIGDDIRLKNS